MHAYAPGNPARLGKHISKDQFCTQQGSLDKYQKFIDKHTKDLHSLSAVGLYIEVGGITQEILALWLKHALQTTPHPHVGGCPGWCTTASLTPHTCSASVCTKKNNEII